MVAPNLDEQDGGDLRFQKLRTPALMRPHGPDGMLPLVGAISFFADNRWVLR
jgi:hypothetical protein